MVSILDGELADTIADALIDAAIPFAVTITRSGTTGGDPADPGSGTTVTTDYPCQGFVDSYSAFDVANSLVLAGDVKIVVIANSLDMPSQPSPGDIVTARGRSYSIINVSADPALALFEIQGRA
jgi:hypothetical protein